MSILTIMRGLPGSGKSTIAKAQMKSNTVRLNRDLLRTMLHFDEWTYGKEKATKQAEMALAEMFLKQGKDVIIDDTNLGHNAQWLDMARRLKVEVDVITVDTPIEECIKRDAEREKMVGKEVILNMALRHEMLNIDRPVVICDLDGTICDLKHRLHYLANDVNESEHPDPFWKKDWKGFFKALTLDPLRQDVHDQVEVLSDTHEIIFVSGRPEEYKEETLEWLNRNVSFPWLTLIMRQKGDKRPDTDVKKQILDNYFKGLNVTHVFDDRPSVIRMWREVGLNVIDVGDGIEF